MNVSEHIFEEGQTFNFEVIRKDFIMKMVEKFDEKYEIEDHLNAGSVLSELCIQPAIYQILTSQESLDQYKEFLSCDCESTKKNLFILLATLCEKY